MSLVMIDTNSSAVSISLLYCSMVAGSQARLALPHTAVQDMPAVSAAYQSAPGGGEGGGGEGGGEGGDAGAHSPKPDQSEPYAAVKYVFPDQAQRMSNLFASDKALAPLNI